MRELIHSILMNMTKAFDVQIEPIFTVLTEIRKQLTYMNKNPATIQSHNYNNGKLGCGINRGDQNVVCDDSLHSFDVSLTLK